MFSNLKNLFGIATKAETNAQYPTAISQSTKNATQTTTSTTTTTTTTTATTTTTTTTTTTSKAVSAKPLPSIDTELLPDFVKLSNTLTQTVGQWKRTTEDIVSSVNTSLTQENLTSSMPSFYEPMPELKMYKDNFGAGSGILFKYTNNLNRIARNNISIIDKANKTDIIIKKSVFNVLLHNNVWNNLNTQLVKLPSLISDMDILRRKIDIVCNKIDEFEKMISALSNSVVTERLNLWKREQDQLYIDKKKQLELDLHKFEQEVTQEDRKLKEAKFMQQQLKESHEHQLKLHQLDKTIGKQLEDFAVYGILKKKKSKSDVALEQVTLDMEQIDLDDFFGKNEEKKETDQLKQEDTPNNKLS